MPSGLKTRLSRAALLIGALTVAVGFLWIRQRASLREHQADVALIKAVRDEDLAAMDRALRAGANPDGIFTETGEPQIQLMDTRGDGSLGSGDDWVVIENRKRVPKENAAIRQLLKSAGASD